MENENENQEELFYHHQQIKQIPLDSFFVKDIRDFDEKDIVNSEKKKNLFGRWLLFLVQNHLMEDCCFLKEINQIRNYLMKEYRDLKT